MPVTLTPWANESLKVNNVRPNFAEDARDLLVKSMDSDFNPPEKILQSSYTEDTLRIPVRPTESGLVWSIINAYNRHHHLKIRPDDVWAAILAQFSAYVNANAEKLREHFVEHEGQKEVRLEYDFGSRFEFDFSRFASDMSHELEKNVTDPTLRDWIIPDFSTTTENDKVVASIIMMGTLQAYFTYTCDSDCGLPSVTLLGEKADWELVLSRLNKLQVYGPEPALFASLLRPIIGRFVGSFDEPDSEEIADFWHRVASWHGGSGMSYYTGWISAFCFWDDKGRQLYREPTSTYDLLTLDDTKYGSVDSDEIPPAWVKVPVKIIDHGEDVKAEMIAGAVGIACTGSVDGEHEAGDTNALDTIQPSSGWWIYEKPEEKPAARSDPYSGWH